MANNMNASTMEGDTSRISDEASRLMDEAGDTLESTRDNLMSEFRNLIAEGESLLRATSSLSGEALANAREKFRGQLATAKAARRRLHRDGALARSRCGRGGR